MDAIATAPVSFSFVNFSFINFESHHIPVRQFSAGKMDQKIDDVVGGWFVIARTYHIQPLCTISVEDLD